MSVRPESMRNFVDALGQFAAGMKITMKDAMLEQAALLCQDMAIFTPPVVKSGGQGLSATARKAGEKAVERDIRKIFVATDDNSSKAATAMAVNQLAYAAKANDFGGFMAIAGNGGLMAMKGLDPILKKIVSDTDKERAFGKAKNWFNRVSVRKTEYGQGYVQELRPIHDRVKGKYGGRLKKHHVASKALVEKDSEIKAYIMDRKKKVGASKSGWAAALRSLPRPADNNGQDSDFGARLRQATWISGQMGVQGYNIASFGDFLVLIRIGNKLGNVDGIADETGALQLAIDNRTKQMPRQVKYRTQKPVDKFNKK